MSAFDGEVFEASTCCNKRSREKVILITTMLRIAKLSFFVTAAISAEVFANFKLSLLSRCATRL